VFSRRNCRCLLLSKTKGDVAARRQCSISCAQRSALGELFVWEAQERVRIEDVQTVCGLVELAGRTETLKPSGGSEIDSAGLLCLVHFPALVEGLEGLEEVSIPNSAIRWIEPCARICSGRAKGSSRHWPCLRNLFPGDRVVVGGSVRA
jgi:hypothetical protein